MRNIDLSQLSDPDRQLLKSELTELLSEAAVEIANLDCPQNIVCQRLRAMQRRLQPAAAGEPLRKFVASEAQLPFLESQRSQQTG